MKDPAWQGDWPINAGYTYSSGSIHAAYDVGMPIGTPLYAPCDAVVKELNDGVANNPGGSPGSGAPSNYVLLWSQEKPERTIYFQHMNKGIPVKVGQKIAAGTKIGTSGNTGNSTGPHLHLAVSNVWTLDQYLYDDGCTSSKYGPYLIYPPTDAWKDEDVALSKDDIDKIAKAVWQIEVDVSTGDQKPEYMSVKQALKQARNQASDAAAKPNAPSVNEIWDENLDSDLYPKTKVRGALRALYEKMKAVAP